MKKIFSNIYFFLFLGFLYLPILILILFSFNESKGRTFTGFSLKWYESLFNNSNILDGIITSLTVAFTSATVATIFGTVSAFGLYKLKGRKKSILLNFTYLPILNPEIITGVSFMLLFVTTKNLLNLIHINFEFGLVTLILAHITFCMPYVILNVLPKLYQMDLSLVDSAMDLGCNRLQTFVKSIFPEIKPGILSGFLMAITYSMDDFVVSYFTTGVSHQPLSVLIFSMTKKRVSPEINALSTILFLVVVVSLLLVNYSAKREKEKEMRAAKKYGYVKSAIMLVLVSSVIFGNLAGHVKTAYAESYKFMQKYDMKYYSRFKGKNIKLKVYNWGEYMALGSDGSANLIEEFEKLTGIKVIYSNYENNEGMYSKLKSNAGNYDVIIPSDYMISKMIDEDMLEKLNFKNIPNFKYINKSLINPIYDSENQYSVPYTYGITAIVYNKKMLNYTPDSWDVLWDENLKNKILMFKNSRDAFAIAEALLGISLNSNNAKELEKAKNLLAEQKPYVQSYVQDQIFDKMEKEEAAVAPCYVGDGVLISKKNKNIAVALPKETKNLFVDAMVIQKGSKNKEAAEMFINFLNEPVIAAENMRFILYSTPNTAARKLLPKDVRNNKYLYPNKDILEKCQYFVKLSDKGNLTMDRLWSQLLLPGNNGISKVILIFIMLALLFFYIRARRRRKKLK